jgi:large subunit ribosomal protein L25
MKTIELSVEKRATRGKNEARRSRAVGRIPAVVYGAGKPTVAVTVDRKSLSDIFREGAGENAIFLLKLEGTDQSRHAMIRELQRDPLTRKTQHIDFVRVMMDTKIRVTVGIGEPDGHRRPARSGIIDLVTRARSRVPSTAIPQASPSTCRARVGDLIRVASLPTRRHVMKARSRHRARHASDRRRRQERRRPAARSPGARSKKGKILTEESAAEDKKEKAEEKSKDKKDKKEK